MDTSYSEPLVSAGFAPTSDSQESPAWSKEGKGAQRRSINMLVSRVPPSFSSPSRSSKDRIREEIRSEWSCTYLTLSLRLPSFLGHRRVVSLPPRSPSSFSSSLLPRQPSSTALPPTPPPTDPLARSSSSSSSLATASTEPSTSTTLAPAPQVLNLYLLSRLSLDFDVDPPIPWPEASSSTLAAVEAGGRGWETEFDL